MFVEFRNCGSNSRFMINVNHISSVSEAGSGGRAVIHFHDGRSKMVAHSFESAKNVIVEALSRSANAEVG